jgi:hypothetical protein
VGQRNINDFLNAMGKATDQSRLGGAAKFGYTLEELVYLLIDMTKLNGLLLLQKGLDEIKGFIPNNYRNYYEGCREFLNNPDSFQGPTVDCKFKLDDQLFAPESKTNTRPFPLSLQFGSHRLNSSLFANFTSERRGLVAMDAYVRETINKDDYVKFVTYASFGVPELKTSGGNPLFESSECAGQLPPPGKIMSTGVKYVYSQPLLPAVIAKPQIVEQVVGPPLLGNTGPLTLRVDQPVPTLPDSQFIWLPMNANQGEEEKTKPAKTKKTTARSKK